MWYNIAYFKYYGFINIKLKYFELLTTDLTFS